MLNTKTLKDFDFAINTTMIAAWGASMLWPLRHGLDSLPWSFPGIAFAAYLMVDAWWRWRNQVEDERVRHIILMSAYLSRQIALAGTLLILLAAKHLPVGPEMWLGVIIVLLLLPDFAARRYLGLKDELNEGRPTALSSAFRIILVSSAGFLLLAVIAFRFIFWRAYGGHP